jgi:hypothetical protein
VGGIPSLGNLTTTLTLCSGGQLCNAKRTLGLYGYSSGPTRHVLRNRPPRLPPDLFSREPRSQRTRYDREAQWVDMLSIWTESDFVRSTAVPVEPEQRFVHPMHEIGVDPAKYISIAFPGGED